MAKKDAKKKDKKDPQQDTVDAIRAAVERGLQLSAEGAQATRERTRELVDEISAAAGRVRQSFEDMRVLDELKRLRGDVEALAKRVSSLERPAASKPAASKPAATSRASAKPAARKRTPAKPRARKSTAKKAATTTARKPAARRSAAKPRASSPPAAKK